MRPLRGQTSRTGRPRTPSPAGPTQLLERLPSRLDPEREGDPDCERAGSRDAEEDGARAEVVDEDGKEDAERGSELAHAGGEAVACSRTDWG